MTGHNLKQFITLNGQMATDNKFGTNFGTNGVTGQSDVSRLRRMWNFPTPGGEKLAAVTE